MLKKGQQKLSTRLCDRVIVRERVKNKSNDHVQKPWAFRKGQTVSELAVTPLKRALMKSRDKLVFRHNLQMIITRIVRKLYLGDIEHIHNNLRSDNNAHTSNARDEMRYWIIESMHVEVELLDQYRWTSDRGITKWFPSPTIDDSEKVNVREVWQRDLAFRMNASSRKVLKEVRFGLLITEPDMRGSRIRRSRCPRTKRVPGWSGFVFGCHRHRLTQTEERERETIRKVPNTIQIY